MEDPNRLQELTVEVQSAVDAYVKSDDIANYDELQIRLKRLQVASSKPTDMLFTFRVQVPSAQYFMSLAYSESPTGN